VADVGWSVLEKWQEARLQDDNGVIAIRFGLAATLYFRDGHTLEKRRAALACFEDYDRLCGSALNWCYASANSARMRAVKKLRDRDMSPFLISPTWDSPEADDQGWAFRWHGGENPKDASPFSIHAFGDSKEDSESKDALSFLQVSFPVLWFRQQPEAFAALVLSWCERLKPYHGYGGIFLMQSPDSVVSQNSAKSIAAFAMRYPGLEIDAPISHSLATVDGIKDGNWLTVLSLPFVATLGGSERLRAQLGDAFTLAEYGDGVLIVAGVCPEVGDRNRNEETPLYKKLAQVLRPIRIPSHHPPYAFGRFAEEGEFTAWLERFDDR
jgi:hypothetical protein